MTNDFETNRTAEKELDLFEQLREKTEEADMNSYLKTSFRGYEKQSVLQYIAMLRKYQQTISDNFYKNQQVLSEEKERLKKSNESLITRLNRIESEYQGLQDIIKTYSTENNEFSANDIMALRKSVAVLQEKIKVSENEKNNLDRKIANMEHTNEGLLTELEQANQGINALKEMIRTRDIESQKQRDMINDLTNQLEIQRDETKYWKGLQSEGKQAELAYKVTDLTQQLSVQSELLEKQNSDAIVKEEKIKTLLDEVAMLKSNLESLNSSMEASNLQNEKILYANESLSSQMKEEYKKSLNIIQEKSDVTIEKLIAVKKLNDAESKISLLELELSKRIK